LILYSEGLGSHQEIVFYSGSSALRATMRWGGDKGGGPFSFAVTSILPSLLSGQVRQRRYYPMVSFGISVLVAGMS
jgi:hypothetical protein